MSKELDYITELERKNRLLGERCNQLLKDKGDLTDETKQECCENGINPDLLGGEE